MPSDPEIRSWAVELARLIEKGIAALQSGDPKRVAGVQRELRQFKDQSPDYADALDMQATLAIFDLDLTLAEDAVAGMKERAAEVYRLGKLISGISEEANADADLLSGTLVKGALDAATEAVVSFSELRDELSRGKADEKALATEIEKVLGTIQTLRNKLEKA